MAQRINVLKISLIVLLGILMLLLPSMARSSYIRHLLILSSVYAILASYWNLLDGYLGFINFGYAAFFGIGAYTSAILSHTFGIPLFISIFLGGILAALIGSIIVIPCLRMGGFSVAIVTLAFGGILEVIARLWISLTHGEMGFWGIPPLFQGSSKAPYLYVIFIFLIISLILLKKLIDSHWGLAFMALREDELAANATGINPAAFKLLASAISCFVAGVVGAFYAHYILTITPAIFGIGYTIQIMAFSLIGGKGTLLGPTIGAFTLIFLGEGFRVLEDYRLVIYGILMILMMMTFPGGIIGAMELGRRVVLKWFNDSI